MVNHVECITLIVKLNLKLQCYDQGETLTITEAGDDDAARWIDERNKGVIFKSFAPFTDCISEIFK